jgi:hypothetical protein
VVVGDPIEYPPDPYSFEARVGTVGFIGRALRDRGVPRQHRWAVWLVLALLALPLLILVVAVVVS